MRPDEQVQIQLTMQQLTELHQKLDIINNYLREVPHLRPDLAKLDAKLEHLEARIQIIENTVRDNNADISNLAGKIR